MTGTNPGAGSGSERNSDAPLDGTRVLVVEDEAFIAIDLEDTIMGSGGEVVDIAVTNASAIALLQTFEVDVVLLDYNLADGAAAPTAHAARRMGVPVVFHSGHASQFELLEAFPDCAVLPKPTPREVIVATLVDAAGGVPRSA